MIEGKKPTGGAPHATAFCDMPECKREEVVACAYLRGGNSEKGPISVPDEKQVHAKLTKQNWSYIKGKLRCPSCEAKRKVVPMKPATTATKAPEPSKRERIQIISMLAEVYDLDAGMYSRGDTDQTVADTLGTMPGFVALVREAEFGPAGGNEDMAALKLEIEQFSKQATQTLNDCTKANESLIRVMEQAKQYRERLAKIEKAVGPRILKQA